MKKTISFIDRRLLCRVFNNTLSIKFDISLLPINNIFSSIKPLILMIWLLFQVSNVYSQVPAKMAPLEVGEIVPKEFWSIEHEVYKDGLTKKETLESYKGKILVMDVWASWCTNCLHSFPKLDSLIRNSGNKVNAIMLNFSGSGDDLKKINLVYRRYEEDHGKLVYPSIINDTLIRDLFNVKTLPLYIWIDRNGRLLAKTGSNFLNIDNVESIYQAGVELDQIIAEKRRKKNEKL